MGSQIRAQSHQSRLREFDNAHSKVHMRSGNGFGIFQAPDIVPNRFIGFFNSLLNYQQSPDKKARCYLGDLSYNLWYGDLNNGK